MKVLHVLHGLNIGGAETYLYNMITACNDNFQFDFLLRSSNNENQAFIRECQKKKYNIFITASYPKSIFKNYFETKKIIIEGKYEIIHIHANSLIYILPILIAKKRKIKIILHSHSMQNNKGGFFGKIVHNINYALIKNIKKENVACSEMAGKWMFKNQPFIVINNAIDIKKFKYDEEVRKRIRKKYNIEDEIVIGHVGRFVDVKNHEFIIKVYERYHKKNPKSKLVLLGDGELKNSIKNMCKQYHIMENVIFIGNVNNVNEYMSLFDIMIYPSKFEGLPFAVIEAQAAGVKVLLSDKISKEVYITNLLVTQSLDSGENVWSQKLEEMAERNIDRVSYNYIVGNTIYNIEHGVKQLTKIYNSI